MFKSRRSRRTIGAGRKTATDWQFINGVVVTLPANTFAQDWIVPPFADDVSFPGQGAWTHATVKKTYATVTLNAALANTQVLDCTFGVIASGGQSSSAVGTQPSNTYLPSVDAEVEWLMRTPYQFVNNTGLAVILQNAPLVEQDRYAVSRSQRKLSDMQGLIWVVENRSPQACFFSLDIRTIMSVY